MALDIVVQCLLKVELFRGLKPLQVAEIARQADRIVYRPGQSIITEGEPGDAAVLIVKGDAIHLAGGAPASSPGYAIPDGSLVGELAMLVETLHNSTVVARGTTRAIRIKREALREQMSADPAVAVVLSNNLAKRLFSVANELKRIDQMLADALVTEPVEEGARTAAAISAGLATGRPKTIHIPMLPMH